MPSLTPRILDPEASRVVGRKPDFGSSRRVILRRPRVGRSDD